MKKKNKFYNYIIKMMIFFIYIYIYIYYNFKLINYVFVLNLRKIKCLIFHSNSLKRIRKWIENV